MQRENLFNAAGMTPTECKAADARMQWLLCGLPPIHEPGRGRWLLRPRGELLENARGPMLRPLRFYWSRLYRREVVWPRRRPYPRPNSVGGL